MKNRKLNILIATTLVVLATNITFAAENGTPYVDGSKPFLAIKDVNRQAEAWAMCAATFKFLGAIFSDTQPAKAQKLSELSNGAEVAVVMSIFSDGFDPNISQDRFEALWSAAKLAGSELPKTSLTNLAAELESMPDAGKEIFFNNLSATLEVCAKNKEGQQMYIDMWHEIMKSGVFKFPDE